MSICHCGTESGYLHDKHCPFPLYNDSKPKMILWQEEYAINKKVYERLELPEPFLSNNAEPIRNISEDDWRKDDR